MTNSSTRRVSARMTCIQLVCGFAICMLGVSIARAQADTSAGARSAAVIARAARDTAFLDSVLRVNRYPIRLEHGRLSGTGAALLLGATDSAQFVVVGESHGVAEIPPFVAALFDTLQAAHGFHYLATENGGEIARMVSAQGIRGRSDAVIAIGRKYPHAFEFWNDQELEALATVGKRSTARGQPIWGFDQEFGAVHVLDRLAAIAPTRTTRVLATNIADSARKIEAVRPFRSGLDRRWIDTADSTTWARLRAVFRPRPGSESARLIDALAISNRLYWYNALGKSDNTWYYRSNMEREEYMKRQFVAQYRQAQLAGDSLPKVVVKVGSGHGGDWLNDLGVHALGGFLRGFATADNRTSFHMIVWLVNEPGTYWTLADSPEFLSLARVGSTREWTLVDLRPLRAQTYSGRLGAMSAAMRDIIFAYDAVLLIGGGTRGTYTRLSTPGR